MALSQKLGLSDSFISHVESETRRAKYNINHLNEIALILECSPKDFWPENKFFRKVNSLERYENYQDYMLGYDPLKDSESLQEHEQDQQAFNKIKSVLPLLDPERSRLIELCLKYGFQYKAIAQLMGTSVTETSNEVKKAIQDIKTIITQEGRLQTKPKVSLEIKLPKKMTEEQEKVLQLRCEKKYSFASIAIELNLSQKEVHQEFMTAYKLMQEKHEQQLESA